MKIIPSGKGVGAEIAGVDLSRPLDDSTFAEVADAFFKHQVVVFRGQKLAPEELSRLIDAAISRRRSARSGATGGPAAGA